MGGGVRGGAFASTSGPARVRRGYAARAVPGGGGSVATMTRGSGGRVRAVRAEARSKEVDVGVFGTKAGMTLHFDEKGNALPITVIGFEEGNVVTMVKTMESDGYDAVQVGYQVTKENRMTKPEIGHLAKNGLKPMKKLNEWKVDNASDYEVGQQIDPTEIFEEGDLVDVAGTTIGKGFQGAIRRWGFRRGRKTHGSHSYREPGSIGPGTTPGRVYPGKKMPGHMGNVRSKELKLEVVRVDKELCAIAVKGSIPGKKGNVVTISKSKRPNFNVNSSSREFTKSK